MEASHHARFAKNFGLMAGNGRSYGVRTAAKSTTRICNPKLSAPNACESESEFSARARCLIEGELYHPKTRDGIERSRVNYIVNYIHASFACQGRVKVCRVVEGAGSGGARTVADIDGGGTHHHASQAPAVCERQVKLHTIENDDEARRNGHEETSEVHSVVCHPPLVVREEVRDWKALLRRRCDRPANEYNSAQFFELEQHAWPMHVVGLPTRVRSSGSSGNRPPFFSLSLHGAR